MSMIAPALDTLLRPAILVRAARCGQQHYRRERDLPRLLRATSAPAPGRALDDLTEMEAEIDAMRHAGTGDYDMAGHVGVLVALLAEVRLARGPGAVSDEGVGL